jgi:hypothetical protein
MNDNVDILRVNSNPTLMVLLTNYKILFKHYNAIN